MAKFKVSYTETIDAYREGEITIEAKDESEIKKILFDKFEKEFDPDDNDIEITQLLRVDVDSIKKIA